MSITLREINQIPSSEIKKNIAATIPKVENEIKEETKKRCCPVLAETIRETSTGFGSLLKSLFSSSGSKDDSIKKCPYSQGGIIGNIIQTASNLKTFFKSAWQNKKDLVSLIPQVVTGKKGYMEWLRDITPRDNVRPVFMPFGTHYAIPYTSFRKDICLSRGDASGITLGKHKVNDKEFNVVLHTPKLGRFYEQFAEIVGEDGLLGSVNAECWHKASSLIDRKDFLTPGAVKNYEPQIIEIYKNKTLETENELISLEGNKKINLKKKSKEAILEILNRCILGNISKQSWDVITDDFFKCAKHRLWGRLFSPLSLPQIASDSAKTGLDTLKELDHVALILLDERLKELEHRKPENLLDVLAIEAAEKVNKAESPQKARKEILRITKIYLELVIAGHASNINSKGFFDYEALSNPDFRAGLVQSIDNLKCNTLDEMIQKVTKAPELMEPFESAAYASFAHNTAIPAFTRQAEFYFEDDSTKSLMTEAERKTFAANCSSPLAQIPQHSPLLFPIIGYTNIALKDNGFLTEDGNLNSESIFQKGKTEILRNIADTESFGQGQRKCIGSAPSLSIIKWGAFFTSYLLWKYPDLTLAQKSKTLISNLYGKEDVFVKRA